jgi:hypothetical protein
MAQKIIASATTLDAYKKFLMALVEMLIKSTPN